MVRGDNQGENGGPRRFECGDDDEFVGLGQVRGAPVRSDGVAGGAPSGVGGSVGGFSVAETENTVRHLSNSATTPLNSK